MEDWSGGDQKKERSKEIECVVEAKENDAVSGPVSHRWSRGWFFSGVAEVSGGFRRSERDCDGRCDRISPGWPRLTKFRSRQLRSICWITWSSRCRKRALEWR